jgi:alpha-L-rhamnosidase
VTGATFMAAGGDRDGTKGLPLATYRKIEQYALRGGTVIATRLPSTAPGFLNAVSESQQIQEISQHLFRETGARGLFIEDESKLGEEAAGRCKPDVTFSPNAPEIGFIHRKLSTGDLYFIANTANFPIQALAKFRDAHENAEWWDPFTGRILRIANAAPLEVSLQPYESRLIVFTNTAPEQESRWLRIQASQRVSDSYSKDVDLSSDWKLTFRGMNQTASMAMLHSWSEDQSFQYYSGQVSYLKIVDIPADAVSEHSLVVDFGESTPVPKPDPLPNFNMRAYLEGPVRDAAEVYVNGQRAGVVWHPPYSIDLTEWLKPGKNELRILVGNTAINSLAGQKLPDYRLLNDRYGERFVPQGRDNLEPLPSGLVGRLRLRIVPRH